MTGPICTELRDGTPVLIRRVGPQDADAVIEGFSALSDKSRLYRFLGGISELGRAEAGRLTDTCPAEHEAIGAIVFDGTERPAGIAHFFRPTPTSPNAELALTVIDRYQGRGLGPLLLGRLLPAARQQSVRSLEALVHPENRKMAGLCLLYTSDAADE